MSITMLMMFAMTEFLLCLYPGPAVLCVISQGMRHGTKASLRGSLGILTGNAIYFIISALGLGAVIVASKTLYLSIKWIGAAYLVYLGIRTIYATFANNSHEQPEIDKKRNARLFWQGLTTQLANPKAIIYFTALLPQFISLERSIPQQLLILGLVSVSLEFPVLVLYGWLSARSRQIFHSFAHQRWIDRVAGTFLIGAGIKLALIRRS